MKKSTTKERQKIIVAREVRQEKFEVEGKLHRKSKSFFTSPTYAR